MTSQVRWRCCALATLAMCVALARGGEKRPATRPEPEQLFTRADTDHDGELSKTEFLQFAARLPNLKDDPARADAMFDKLDTDKDGSISVDEFKGLFTRGPRQGPTTGPPTPPGKPAEHAAATKTNPPTPEQLAFFEKSVRPVLSQYCYKCHSADSAKSKGGLLLDTRRHPHRW